MHGFDGMGFGGWMFIWWVLIVVIIGLLVWWLIKNTRSGESRESALDILKKRYARGEITKEEFEDRKKDLM